MKLVHADEKSLAALGAQASDMLVQLNFRELAEQFGYALAYERDPAAALEADYLKAVASPHHATDQRPIRVKYFTPNDTGLHALVECSVPLANEQSVLLELVVTGSEDKHITIEGISGSGSQAQPTVQADGHAPGH